MSLETSSYSSRRTTRSIYESYLNSGERSNNKSKFESRDVFRAGCSQYNMDTREITPGADCKWDIKNCSGVPLDYSPEYKTLFVDGTDAHTLVLGATGSKKSRLVVMPMVRTLAAAGENMIICDPKGEIYKRVADFLSDVGYAINVINLREPDKGDGWNMLAIPYQLFLAGEIDKACEFINDATINLIPVTAKDPYWDYSARDMLFGLILLLFTICKEKEQDSALANMQNVLKLREELFSSNSSSSIQNTNLWKFAKQGNFIHDLIRMRLIGTVNCPEKTLACIVSTFDQHMSCFALQPQVVNMLSASTFDVKDIGFGKNAVFLIMPDEKTTYHQIITIFIKQIYELLIDNAYTIKPDNRYPVRVNFILDEFSSLPTISDFPQMIAASRSRNIRFTLIVQSKHQLKQRYEDETETIMSNCSNWMFLTSREIELLREISDLSGTESNNQQPLISVSRLQHLDKERGECLVFSGRKYPYLSRLPDIDIYDGGEYTEIEMETRKRLPMENMPADFFKSLVASQKQTSVEDSHLSSLQQELEQKFDELFGASVDSKPETN